MSMKTIKQINEEIEKILNEETEVKAPKTGLIDITFNYGYCATEEVDNNDTVYGANGTDWENRATETFEYNISNSEDFINQIVTNIGEYLEIPHITKEDFTGYDVAENIIKFTVYVNELNNPPTEEEMKSFKDGDIHLWAVDGYVELDITEENSEILLNALADMNINI